MNDKDQQYKKEIVFFHKIAPEVIEIAEESLSKITTYTFKEHDNTLNYATDADLHVEKVIISLIQQLFPQDKLLSEEGYSKESIPIEGRVWIIDPICGTANLGRSIPIFATNIALVENGKTVAVCVVDHLLKRYIWSTISLPIYINNSVFKHPQKTGGVIIDVDLIASARLNTRGKEVFAKFMNKIIVSTDYVLVSYISSLNFVYCALGTVDAYVSSYNHVWDVVAANFLIEKSGGKVTDTKGNPWNLHSSSVIAARDEALHSTLLKMFLESQ